MGKPCIRCPICLETADLDDDEPWSALYGCGHMFHGNCLAQALACSQKSIECPYCRVKSWISSVTQSIALALRRYQLRSMHLHLQAPALRPDRTEKAVHHRVYPPLAAHCAVEHEEQENDVQEISVSPARPARLYISPGEYRDKVQEVRPPSTKNPEISRTGLCWA